MTSFKYLTPKRILRHFAVALAYGFIASVALASAYFVRFDFSLNGEHRIEFCRFLPLVVGVKLLFLLSSSQFGSLLTFFSVPDLRRVLGSSALAGGTLAVTWVLSSGNLAPPRGVIFGDSVVFAGLVCAFRFALRAWRERFGKRGKPNSRISEPVAIIGAGDAGANLAHELLSKPGFGLNPVVFLDDNVEKWGARLHGIPVVGGPDWLLSAKAPSDLRRVIIAMPSADKSRISRIILQLEGRGLQLETIPSLAQMLQGWSLLTGLRRIRIEDLLGREPAKLDSIEIRQMIAARVAVVTGAGGSIGAELCRQILSYGPSKLLLVEQCEGQLFVTEQELIKAGYGNLIVPIVADICDRERMSSILAEYRPHLLFHAAAHKHVPMMESQPVEALRNNAFGTAQLARLAYDSQVDRFVLISTDKAINPSSVMGATKRVAEVYLQSFQASHAKKTSFISVRFGNVLGSSGSVVPIFEKQIASGGPVRVTHPDVTRYFMTIPEAVGLVLQSACMGDGGEIFLLDMGKPIKIVDLAEQMILLRGMRPGQDIQIEFTGLRPGEKLFEELSYTEETMQPTAHPMVYRLRTEAADFQKVDNLLCDVVRRSSNLSPGEVKRELVRLVPEYRPHNPEPTKSILGLAP